MEKGDIVICLNSNTASDLRVGNSYIIKSTNMMAFNEKYIRLEGVDFGHNSKFFKIKSMGDKILREVESRLGTKAMESLKEWRDEYANKKSIEELKKAGDVYREDNLYTVRPMIYILDRIKELEKLNK